MRNIISALKAVPGCFFLLMFLSFVITVLSLLLGIGIYDIQIFFDYFRHPLIFILNWLPVIISMLLLLGLTGKLWISYLATAIVVLLASVGSFYKMRFRGEPFMATDLSVIGTALGVAGDFNLTPNTRILAAFFAIPAGTGIGLLARPIHISGKSRIVWSSVTVLCAVVSGVLLYSSEDIYKYKTVSVEHIHSENLAGIEFISKGSIYPFLYSFRDFSERPLEGYDREEAASELSFFSDVPIPDDKRINLIVFQLESFCDLETIGIKGIDPETYSVFHRLKSESVFGNLITNVIGGGTINTERTLLTGSSQLMEYKSPAYSHIWYLREQGYKCISNHPYNGRFYSRESIMRRLGFQEFWNSENRFTDVNTLNLQWMSDYLLFPEVTDQFLQEVHNGENVCSFTVTTQGHGGYSTETYQGDYLFWKGDAFPQEAVNAVNDYLSCVYDTQQHLWDMTERLRKEDEPIVMVLYGDHKPLFATSGDFYSDLHINMDRATEEGFVNYYGTEYLIWANDKAKEILHNDFCGEGPTISPCFLMTYVFDLLDWQGSAYMQFNRTVMEQLPVINTYGFYMKEDKLVTELPPKEADLLKKMNELQYYVAHEFRPD